MTDYGLSESEARLEAAITAEVNARMERHNLQQAHQRLRDAKAAVGRAKSLELPIEALAVCEALTLNIEDAAWKIEQLVIERGGIER